jgi:Tfp pilus assembly protein PilN
MINLLPADLKEARQYGRRNRSIVGYCFGVIVIGAATVSIAFFNMRFVMADESRIKTEMESRQVEAEKLETGQKEVDKIASQLKTIDKLYSGEVKFSDLIPKIGSLLPNGMVLNALTLTGGKTSPLQLDVDMESQNLAAVFQQNLVNSDLFEAADISNITAKGGGTPKPGVKSYPFGATLTASFKGSAAAKKPATPAPTTPAPASGGSQ